MGGKGLLEECQSDQVAHTVLVRSSGYDSYLTVVLGPLEKGGRAYKKGGGEAGGGGSPENLQD